MSAFAPGRVDLGPGRSAGFTAPVRRALRQADSDFAADLRAVPARNRMITHGLSLRR